MRFIKFALIYILFASQALGAQSPTAPKKENLIVFIHGFMGNNQATWTNHDSKAFWPDLIKSDDKFLSFDTDTYSYTAALTQQSLTTNELSTRFLEYLMQKTQEYNNVFIIAHSFGGIITMDTLSKLADSETKVFEKIKGIFLLAVPFKGTDIVTKSLRYLVPSQIMDELEASNTNSFLQNLDTRWLKLTKERAREHKLLPQIHVAYETKKTGVLFFRKILVDRNALFPYHDDLTAGPLPAQTNHSDIAKPSSNKDEIYRWAARYIDRILEGYSPTIIADYGVNLEQSKYYFDTQSELPASVFSTKALPPLRIFSEDPYSSFNCFDYEQFRLIKETSDYLVFSNENDKSPTTLRFYYMRSTRNVIFYFGDVVFNASKEDASYTNRLDFSKFIRALTNNARLVFWDIEKDSPLFRTGHVLPTNIMSRDNAELIESILQEIVQIERYFGIKFRYRTKYTMVDIEKIKYIGEVLRGKEISLGKTITITLSTLDEKKRFLRGLIPADYIEGYRYHFDFEDEKGDLFGTAIDLGKRNIRVPEAEFKPNAQYLKENLDKSTGPVTIQIDSLNPNIPIKLWHYRQMVTHELPIITRDALQEENEKKRAEKSSN
ncbi:MAG: hypothetical protein A2X28_07130 [Elusimicrobia bacterium GWA2_56_46]|nr:MAG: hypothetical protein A2X28_07130 [Elusimicrobia bacterium GWA2_56_46]OGR54782.1 MAG: hypothetical protein A2X39_10860 [Elusimicrobia bacterium GWC2_56_31]HBB67963.1 hypothetical protein [Elusimicrobiota bacterium]HBW23428.1 hypothetical protein [Elusimicrobiota bacterium]